MNFLAWTPPIPLKFNTDFNIVNSTYSKLTDFGPYTAFKNLESYETEFFNFSFSSRFCLFLTKKRKFIKIWFLNFMDQDFKNGTQRIKILASTSFLTLVTRPKISTFWWLIMKSALHFICIENPTKITIGLSFN